MSKVLYIDEFRGVQNNKDRFSNKLMWELKDFFAKHDSGYYDEREDEGILCFYYKLGNGICLKFEISIRQEDFLCDTEIAATIKTLSQVEELKLLRKINEVNNELDYGYFALTKRYGGEVTIIYKTYFEPQQGADCFDGLEKMIGYPMEMIRQYGEDILACVGIRVKV